MGARVALQRKLKATHNHARLMPATAINFDAEAIHRDSSLQKRFCDKHRD